MAEHRVVLFHSTAHAMRAEKVLLGAGLRIKMIPTPRKLSSNCGMALRFDCQDEQRVAATLADNRVPTNGIYSI
jgi:hypothetical protein